MQIRPATPADVPAVLPMVAKIAELHESWDPAKYGYRPNVAEMYRSWMGSRANDPKSVFLVAEREEKLVGFLVATVEREIPIYRLDQFGFIHDLWVEPDYRNEGIARQMTMLAIEKFRAIGVKQVRLDTHAKNDAARALFASCGFRASVMEMLLELND
jgi:ribosomal protein S18 acetylase RimI-like enzyme